MNQNFFAIIMAGGVGSRFWPVSTPEMPKQFLDLLGTGETLIQKTFQRLNNIIPSENILILTHEDYKKIVLEQLTSIDKEQIITEPAMRNTAPCIIYASLKIKKINPNALILVAPSDHWIENEGHFIENVKQGFDYCEKENSLLTLGIQPTFPNTGFGYIEFDKSEINPIKSVIQFREKPNYETAKAFLASGNFLWNAGIFIWKAASIINAFEEHQPEMLALFQNGYDDLNTISETNFINNNYSLAENISIDFAIMEKASNVVVLPATFDWNDLGTWGSLHEKSPKDINQNAIINAQTILENASNNMIFAAKNKKIIIDGLEDYIIVDKDDILLIYPKSKEQEIKRISTLL